MCRSVLSERRFAGTSSSLFTFVSRTAQFALDCRIEGRSTFLAFKGGSGRPDSKVKARAADSASCSMPTWPVCSMRQATLTCGTIASARDVSLCWHGSRGPRGSPFVSLPSEQGLIQWSISRTRPPCLRFVVGPATSSAPLRLPKRGTPREKSRPAFSGNSPWARRSKARTGAGGPCRRRCTWQVVRLRRGQCGCGAPCRWPGR